MAARGLGPKYQGSKWIRPEKRLAIYLRDGMACCYCGAGIEDEGNLLTLDHLTPHSLGGSNRESNLITSCRRCNSSRGSRDITAFVRATADYLGANATDILDKITRNTETPLNVKEARDIIARRGGSGGAE